MLLDWIYVALGLLILLLAGDVLVKGAVNLALRLGIPALIVSLTIVAFGTSAPELLIAIDAVLDVQPGLAVGNVVGSNIYNILLIGGATMSLAPQALPSDLAGTQMILLTASALVVLGLVWFAKSIGRLVGAALVTVFAANVVLVFA